MVERRRPQLDEHLAVARHRIRHVLVAQHLRAAVLVDADRLHGHNPRMTADEIAGWVRSSGSTRSAWRRPRPTTETERHIRERRARGLFAEMKFTMAQPERSCHPETLLPGARSVVSAALCYWQPEPPLAAGARAPRRATRGRTPTPSCASSSTRSAGGSAAPTGCSSTRTSTSTARRLRARGVGFYGKNTMLITRRHGSWVVLGTLVTDVELEPTPPLDADCGDCTALHRRVPDRRARRAGHARRDAVPLVLDAGARAIPERVPCASSARRSTAATSARTSARGTAASRSGAPIGRAGRRRPRRSRRLARGRRRPSSSDYDRLYVPRNDRASCAETRSSRSATPAGPSTRGARARTRTIEHARWAIERDRRAREARRVVVLGSTRGAGRSSAASARARSATWARSSGGSSTIASPR